MSRSLAFYAECRNCGYILISWDGRQWWHDSDDREQCDDTGATFASPVDGWETD